VDVQAFLEGRGPALHAIEASQLETARAIGLLECPGCGSQYGITMGAPRYWWYPVRMDRGTGPGGAVLEERPVYRAQAVEQQV
jgi:hypothetical protein